MRSAPLGRGVAAPGDRVEGIPGSVLDQERHVVPYRSVELVVNLVDRPSDGLRGHVREATSQSLKHLLDGFAFVQLGHESSVNASQTRGNIGMAIRRTPSPAAHEQLGTAAGPWLAPDFHPCDPGDVATSRPEVELTLEVSPEAVMPDLSGLRGVATVDLVEESTLESLYLDATDLRLARAGVTLCRRTGGTGAGWRLESPVSSGEPSVMLGALGPDELVPGELVAAVRARVRAEPLAPVAVVSIRHTVRVLRDANAHVLAEVADDTLTSRSPNGADAGAQTWRQWTVALVEGDARLVSSSRKLLRTAGGTTPRSSSTLARVFGDRVQRARVEEGDARVGAGSAGVLLGDHLRARRNVLIACDPLVRRDAPDGVHQMRVATRELRSALATFKILLVRERSEAVRVELGWLAGLLGVARDAEVGRALLAALVAGEPGELVIGAVADDLDRDRVGAYRTAREQVIAALDSPRYFQLLDALDALVDDPPLSAAATGPAGAVMPALVRRDWRRLARAYTLARHAPPGPRRDGLLHEVRKAAKRARYSAEAVIPVSGRPAESFARAAKDLQTLLGDHHDSVELRALLRRLAIQAHLEGQDTFSYGRLHAIEQSRAEGIEDRLPSAWDRVAARRRRRWLH